MHLHHLPQIAEQLHLDPALLMTNKLPHIAASAVVLAGPGLTALVWDRALRGCGALAGYALALAGSWTAALQQQLGGGGSERGGERGGEGSQMAMASLAGWQPPPPPQFDFERAAAGQGPSFVEASYAFLPLCWAATLSNYYDALLEEAGRILPVSGRPPGGSAALGTASTLRQLRRLLV